jgi:hypothetical protein
LLIELAAPSCAPASITGQERPAVLPRSGYGMPQNTVRGRGLKALGLSRMLRFRHPVDLEPLLHFSDIVVVASSNRWIMYACLYSGTNSCPVAWHVRTDRRASSYNAKAVPCKSQGVRAMIAPTIHLATRK